MDPIMNEVQVGIQKQKGRRNELIRVRYTKITPLVNKISQKDKPTVEQQAKTEGIFYS